MIEFVNAIERHEDEIVTIEDEQAETVKTFPSEWQSKAMSKSGMTSIGHSSTHHLQSNHWITSQWIIPYCRWYRWNGRIEIRSDQPSKPSGSWMMGQL